MSDRFKELHEGISSRRKMLAPAWTDDERHTILDALRTASEVEELQHAAFDRGLEARRAQLYNSMAVLRSLESELKRTKAELAASRNALLMCDCNDRQAIVNEQLRAELEAMTKRAESAEKLLGEYTSSRHEHGEFIDIGQLSDVEIRRTTLSRIEQLQAELEAVKRERDELREENHKLSEALEYHMPPLIASFRDEITTNARKLLAERKKP